MIWTRCPNMIFLVLILNSKSYKISKQYVSAMNVVKSLMTFTYHDLFKMNNKISANEIKMQGVATYISIRDNSLNVLYHHFLTNIISNKTIPPTTTVIGKTCFLVKTIHFLVLKCFNRIEKYIFLSTFRQGII